MGLFGPSKKEKALQAEVERLNKLLLPEQREIEKLNKQISGLRDIMSGLETKTASANNLVNQLNAQANKINAAAFGTIAFSFIPSFCFFKRLYADLT